ncbi:MAG: endolytic transglycosylase MltG [Chloroflexota bacterium]|nr:endolytic transglycosylase MltG [Chloroflexota bacterium]
MERRSSCKTFTVLAVIVGCVIAFGAYMLLVNIPGQAEHTFGPPAPNLSYFQRIYLSQRLTSDQDELTTAHNPFQEEVPFQIEVGETTYSITNHLEQLGLIQNAAALRNYMVYSGVDTFLQAGDYTLSARMTPVEIAQVLHNATPKEITFQILPGWRLEEIAESLPTSGLAITPQEFLNAARNPAPDLVISEYLHSGASLEGFMYPDAFLLPRETNVAHLLNFLTNQFISHIDQEMLTGFSDQGLDLYQAVTLASIIQREAVQEDEMRLIASVFLNRLAAGWKLESDPTAQYALGYDPVGGTWWTNPLSLQDLKYDSPYNTYLYPELPPGPISNPGRRALESVAYPAVSNYFYFRAACDGSGNHTFAQTFEEHVNNACQE